MNEIRDDFNMIVGRIQENELARLQTRVQQLEALIETADKIIVQPTGSVETRRLEWHLAKNEVMGE